MFLQSLLERHVNNHFKNNEPLNGSVTNKLHSESSNGSTKSNNLASASRSSASNQSTGYSSKLLRKLIGKRIKYRKTPYSARILDVFDIGAMAQVRMRLSEVCLLYTSPSPRDHRG